MLLKLYLAITTPHKNIGHVIHSEPAGLHKQFQYCDLHFSVKWFTCTSSNQLWIRPSLKLRDHQHGWPGCNWSNIAGTVRDFSLVGGLLNNMSVYIWRTIRLNWSYLIMSFTRLRTEYFCFILFSFLQRNESFIFICCLIELGIIFFWYLVINH